MATLPEWLPQNYILQIRENTCDCCAAVETSSQLWLVEKHYLNKTATRRTEAKFVDARLPRGTSTRRTTTPACVKCFSPYEPVYQPRAEDLELLHPGKPVPGNNYSGLSLDDL